MKKLMTSMTLFLGLLIGSSAFASNSCLSVALNNLSTGPVEFSTTADPGYIPVVNVNETLTLPADFMVTCSPIDHTCTIMIVDDNKKITTIYSVLQGTLIVYAGVNQYYLDKNADIRCP